MRCAGFIFLCVLFAAPMAHAQFVPTTVYDAPPTSLRLPSEFSLEGATAARGNLVRWRDAERQRIGAYRSETDRNGVTRVTNALPDVGGYFVIFEGGRALPGIVQGNWSRPDSALGQRMVQRNMLYAQPHQVCGSPRARADVEFDSVTYLGHQWRPEFDQIDQQLRGAVSLNAEAIPRSDPPMGYETPPTARDFSRYYPMRALDREREGGAILNCFVRPDRTLTCGVESEDPPGLEFGEAARMIMEAPSVRVPAQAVHGEETAGRCIQRRVAFRLG